MTAPTTPPRPMDPRLLDLPPITARKLNQLPTTWLDQLLTKDAK